jgi:hypothetical protein
VAKKVLVSKSTGVEFGYDEVMASTGLYDIVIIDDEPERPKKTRRKPKAIDAPKVVEETVVDSDPLDLEDFINGLDDQ